MRTGRQTAGQERLRKCRQKPTRTVWFGVLLVVGWAWSAPRQLRAFDLEVPNLETQAQRQVAEEFAGSYERFARNFSDSYAGGMAFSNLLGEQIGSDRLPLFPSFTAGVALGASIGKTRGFNQAGGDDILFSGILPKSLPTLTPGVIIGTGINSRWDARLKIFPATSISMPANLVPGENTSTSFRLSSYGAGSRYKIIPGGPFRFGVSVGGLFNYYGGKLNIVRSGLEVDSVDFDDSEGDLGESKYDFTTSGEWHMFTLGPEIKVYYDIYVLNDYLGITPYFGYGPHFTVGSFETRLKAEGDIQVKLPNGTQRSSPLKLDISRKGWPYPINHRMFAGLEFGLFVLKIGMEFVVNLGEGSLGVNLGSRVSF